MLKQRAKRFADAIVPVCGLTAAQLILIANRIAQQLDACLFVPSGGSYPRTENVTRDVEDLRGPVPDRRHEAFIFRRCRFNSDKLLMHRFGIVDLATRGESEPATIKPECL